MNDVLKKILMILVTSCVLMTIFMSIILIVYVAGWNYIVIPTYNTSVSTLNDSGMITPAHIAAADEAISALPKIYEYMDYIFLFCFTSIILGLPVLAYNSKREGFGELFGMLTMGNVILLFLTGIFIQISEWIYYNLIEQLLPSLTDTMPLFSQYIDNAGLVNLIVFVICIIANYVDFEELKYYAKKKDGDENQRYSGGDEIV